MKNISKFAAAALIAGFALTGCSMLPEPAQPTLSPAGEVAKTVDEFYTKSVEKAPEAVKNFEDGPEQMLKLLSAEDAKKLDEASNPFDGLNKLSVEGQAKVAEFYGGLDPVSDYYSYEGLTDAQRAGVSLTSLVSTSFLTTLSDAESARDINESDIEMIDDTHAIADFKSDEPAETSETEIYLVKTDSGWKIDGQKTYDQYLEEMKK